MKMPRKKRVPLDYIGCSERLDYVERVILPHEDASKCLVWPFKLDRNGYGILNFSLGAHYYVCHRANGVRPTPRHVAAHECGNPSCVNPRHLVWKDQTQNRRDTIRHGTHSCGERAHQAKLTNGQADEIRRLWGEKQFTQPEIGKMFGVSEDVVCKIVGYKSYIIHLDQEHVSEMRSAAAKARCKDGDPNRTVARQLLVSGASPYRAHKTTGVPLATCKRWQKALRTTLAGPVQPGRGGGGA